MNSTRLLDIAIEPMTQHDWNAVRAIYLEGIATGNATFETSAPDWNEWNAAHLPSCRLVARSGSGVLGWVALSPVSPRRVYAGVAEVSIYVAECARGQQIGSKLMAALVGASEGEGIWTLQAGILAENTHSVALHEQVGFRIVGRRERLASLHGHWRDVILMERRSAMTGV